MKQSLGGSTEAAFSFVETSAGIGNRAGLHLLSPGWCTLSRLSYATLRRYCRNYALQLFDARRNRRNAPSVARFSLSSHPWELISVHNVHNSTVSRQLRYSLTQDSVHQPSHVMKPLALWQNAVQEARNRQKVLKLGIKHHLNSDVFKLKMKRYENSDTNLKKIIFTKSIESI